MAGWIGSTAQQNMNLDNSGTNPAPTTNTGATPPKTQQTPISQPDQKVVQQVETLTKNNKQLDDTFNNFTKEDVDNIIKDYQSGASDEEITEKYVGKINKNKKGKKDIPWDVIATAISGIGAMFGVTPFMDFTQYGFDVTNRRDERKARSKGRATGQEKAGEGDVINENQNEVGSYTEQRKEENLADNAAAMKMAEDQLRAEFENLDLTLSSQEKIAFEQMKNNKDIAEMSNTLQKELADKGYTHTKEMVDIMAQGQYKAYLTAKEKGFKGSYADYNRSEAGRATWEAAIGAVAQIGGAAAQAYGAISGK